MIRLAIICLIVAGVAALLGFGGVAGAFVGIAKILFFIALGLFILFIILGVMAGKKVSKMID